MQLDGSEEFGPDHVIGTVVNQSKSTIGT
jgi:hypothetical protein